VVLLGLKDLAFVFSHAAKAGLDPYRAFQAEALRERKILCTFLAYWLFAFRAVLVCGSGIADVAQCHDIWTSNWRKRILRPSAVEK
jgi:hypothetical protein